MSYQLLKSRVTINPAIPVIIVIPRTNTLFPIPARLLSILSSRLKIVFDRSSHIASWVDILFIASQYWLSLSMSVSKGCIWRNHHWLTISGDFGFVIFKPICKIPTAIYVFKIHITGINLFVRHNDDQ